MFRTTAKNGGSRFSFWGLFGKRSSRTSGKPSTPSGNSSPRRFMSTISNKAMQLRQKKRVGEELDGGEGVWQRSIMMGDKCQPLDFSGVIFYDSDGNRISELPMRSPRASPLPSYAYKSEKQSSSRLGW